MIEYTNTWGAFGGVGVAFALFAIFPPLPPLEIYPAVYHYYFHRIQTCPPPLLETSTLPPLKKFLNTTLTTCNSLLHQCFQIEEVKALFEKVTWLCARLSEDGPSLMMDVCFI